MTMSVTSPVFLQLLPSWCTAAFPPAGLLYDNVASRQVAAARQFGRNRRQTGLADDGLVSSKLTHNVTSPSQIDALRKLVRPDGR
jgi:hypothetical protein